MSIISAIATTATSAPAGGSASGRLLVFAGFALGLVFVVRLFKQWIREMQESEE